MVCLATIEDAETLATIHVRTWQTAHEGIVPAQFLGVPPDAVAFAQSTKEASEIVKICAQHKVPLIPFGSGTGLEVMSWH